MIRIGTSGYHYRHWRDILYPPGLPTSEWLRSYAREFDTVELNATFYKLPTETAIAGWYQQVPPGFLFAAKGSRFLTHLKKLKDTTTGLDRYFSRIRGLQDKLGPVLWQLPPGWNANPERLESFLAALPDGYRYAFEFRDESWYTPEIYRLLARYGAALCIFHMAGFQTPLEITADFTYIRLHGNGSRYQGNYPDETLKTWARRITGWAEGLEAVYAYFNNDAHGYAVMNARKIREYVRAPIQNPVGTSG